MGTVGQHTPAWLSEAAFNDKFDWTKSLQTTFPAFFEHVTLHDSSWQTINLNVTNETILSIELDAFWNKAYSEDSTNSKPWPYLAIKIPNVISVSYNTVDYATTISDTSSVVVRTEEIEALIGPLSNSTLFPKEFYSRLIDSKEVHRTQFDDIYGGNIVLLHDSLIRVLLVEESGVYLDPSLEKTLGAFDDKPATIKVQNLIAKIWDKLKGS
jgi:hypothetical protein